MADYKKSSVHCHSTMCDGKNTLQEMASAACAQGLTTLGFSGHSYTQRDREYCMSPSRTAQYKATIAKLKAEYKGKVDILCGIVYSLLPMIIDLFFVLAAAISFPSCFMLHPVFPELLKTSL